MMKAPAFWSAPADDFSLPRMVLTPPAALYQFAGQLRHSFSQPDHVGRPVICVGNISLGGTGKTPICMMLAALLSAQGEQPAVISRGYGGSQKSPLQVDPARHTAELTGDEPLMMAAQLPVFIARNRPLAARLAVQNKAGVLLMDDGLQNPSLARCLNLVVVDRKVGFGNGAVFPAGPLREPVMQALLRADVLILMGDALHNKKNEHETNQNEKNEREDILALIEMAETCGIDIFQAQLKPRQIEPQQMIAFCGIGRPEKFYDLLEQSGYTLHSRHSFADHHHYTAREARDLLALAARENLPLITTQKDMARLTRPNQMSTPSALSATSELAQQAQVFEVEAVCDEPERLTRRIMDALAEDRQSHLYTSP